MSTKMIEALEIAIATEAEARDNYENIAKIAEDPETRLMLEQLAREENAHFQRLCERLKAIKLLG